MNGQQRPSPRPTPRPATTPTTSNTNEAHAISNGSGHQDNPHLGQQPRPRHRTLLWNTHSTPTTTTGRQRDDQHLDHQPRPRHRTPPTPTPPPTPSHTNHPPTIDPTDDPQQPTSRPSTNQPHVCGVGHPGEAGRVTPGRRRGQLTRQPTPRPAATPTTSNTNEAHAINTDDG